MTTTTTFFPDKKMEITIPRVCEIRTNKILAMLGDFSAVAHGFNLKRLRSTLYARLMHVGGYTHVCLEDCLYPKLERPELPYLISQKIGYDYLVCLAWEDDVDKDVLSEIRMSLVAYERGTRQDYGWVNPSAIYGLQDYSFTDMLVTGYVAPSVKFIRFAPIAHAISDYFGDLTVIDDPDDLIDLPICKSVELVTLTNEEWSIISGSSYDDGYNESIFTI